MVGKENNRANGKVTRYVDTYNKLLKMIQDGLYPEGCKLPTEPDLALQLEVSRSTLRQSLALLQEDGILQSRKGIGNFVRKTLNDENVGLEKMENPFYKSCNCDIDQVDIELELQFTSEHIERVLERKTAVALAIHRHYKKDNIIIGTSFSHVATDLEYLNTIDPNNKKEMLEFLEHGIYHVSHASILEIKLVEASEAIKKENKGNKTAYYQLVVEKIRDGNGKVIAYSKYYIPFENADFKIVRTR